MVLAPCSGFPRPYHSRLSTDQRGGSSAQSDTVTHGRRGTRPKIAAAEAVHPSRGAGQILPFAPPQAPTALPLLSGRPDDRELLEARRRTSKRPLGSNAQLGRSLSEVTEARVDDEILGCEPHELRASDWEALLSLGKVFGGCGAARTCDVGLRA